MSTPKKILIEGMDGCHARGTQILLYSGKIKPVEEIEVGDQLMGPDSKPRHVLALRRGRSKMFMLRLKRSGEEFIVNENHYLFYRNTAGRVNMDRIAKLSEFITYPDQYKRCSVLVKSGRIEFPNHTSALPLPPYILGCWLGDGNSSGTVLTNMDNEVIEEWKEYGKSLGLKINIQRSNPTSKAFRISLKGNRKHGSNPFLNKLKSLDLKFNKHIPEEYLLSSAENRLQLLAGLLDTDGDRVFAHHNGSTTITSKWSHLADQIIFLARSLGFAANVHLKWNDKYQRNYYRVHIGGNLSDIPTRVPYKKYSNLSGDVQHLHRGFDVIPLKEEEDYFGFVIDEDHLFLDANFNIHHNSGKDALMTVALPLLEKRHGIKMTVVRTTEAIEGDSDSTIARAALIHPKTDAQQRFLAALYLYQANLAKALATEPKGPLLIYRGLAGFYAYNPIPWLSMQGQFKLVPYVDAAIYVDAPFEALTARLNNRRREHPSYRKDDPVQDTNLEFRKEVYKRYLPAFESICEDRRTPYMVVLNDDGFLEGAAEQIIFFITNTIGG